MPCVTRVAVEILWVYQGILFSVPPGPVWTVFDSPYIAHSSQTVAVNTGYSHIPLD